MKRDWGIIRQVLIEVESLPYEARLQFGYSLDRRQSPDERNKVEHAFLLQQGGYLAAIEGDSLDGGSLLAPELTWSGHELLDTLRSRPVWDRIKTTAQQHGIELTVESVKVLSTKALEWVLSRAA